MKNIIELVSNFDIVGKYLRSQDCNNGHINDTYIIFTDSGKNYVLQKINNYVFKNVDQLMANISGITDFLMEVVRREGGDPARETMRIIRTKENGLYYKDSDGTYWRMYSCIMNAVTYQRVENPAHFYEAGKGFGIFQRRLKDFDALSLYETIPDFHNTKKRYENFLRSVERNESGRLDDVREEVAFVKERADKLDKIVSLMEKGELPSRVTHNDTKLNNVMLDKDTGKAICVIDLDTVMPSTLLYDFGDALRFGCNTATEETENLNDVHFSLDLFDVFSRGFIEGIGKENLTKKEIELLPFSAWIMTIECGIRFLQDYIDGDKYFRVSKPQDNKIRCRTQFKLVREIEEKENVMNAIIKEITK